MIEGICRATLIFAAAGMVGGCSRTSLRPPASEIATQGGGVQSGGGQLTGGQPSTGGQLTGGQPSAGGQLTGGQVTAGQLTGGQVTAGQLTGGQVTAGQLTGGAPAGECGDGVVQPWEECDGGSRPCAEFGLEGDVAPCSLNQCFFNIGACGRPLLECGNGIAGEREDCDGDDLNWATCQSLGYGGGTLRCDSGCALVVEDCSSCGNGRVNAGEVCDDTDLAGQSCRSLGYLGGSLACNSECDAYAIQDCTVCGDGFIGQGENCDGTVFEDSCESLGLGTGTLSCSKLDCRLDTTACEQGPACGNGVVESGEGCEADVLMGSTCITLGFDTGALACNGSTCRVDSSDCSRQVTPDCSKVCIQNQCQQAVEACEATMGCNEILDCLDGCRTSPDFGCAASCASSLEVAAIALIASDCVSDCALECN